MLVVHSGVCTWHWSENKICLLKCIAELHPAVSSVCMCCTVHSGVCGHIEVLLSCKAIVRRNIIYDNHMHCTYVHKI